MMRAMEVLRKLSRHQVSPITDKCHISIRNSKGVNKVECHMAIHSFSNPIFCLKRVICEYFQSIRRQLLLQVYQLKMTAKLNSLQTESFNRSSNLSSHMKFLFVQEIIQLESIFISIYTQSTSTESCRGNHHKQRCTPYTIKDTSGYS